MIDRRTWMKTSLGATAGLPAARVLGANNQPAFGLIACGGRGRYLLGKFLAQGARCVALCDVYEPHLEQAKKLAPEAKTYVAHEDLLAQSGLDFIVAAGPDHWHCAHLLDSLKAGKDVYTEKPLSKSLDESRRMVEAVRKSGRIVQVGMQRRSAGMIFKAKSLVDEGALGRITMVKAQWHWNVARPLDNSPLPGRIDWERFTGLGPKRPLEPRRYRYWRYFWDYAGGNMTDQGTHLLDVVQWFTGAGAPRSAVCQGYVAKNTGAEHADVFCAVFDHGEFLTTWTLDYCNAFENGWSILFMGDKGTLRLDEAGFKFWPEPWPKQPGPAIDEQAPVPVESHIANFLACLKTRQAPNCPVEVAAQAVAGPHLANLAFLKGRRMKLGPDLVQVS
jgi:predicted dehydrogenase